MHLDILLATNISVPNTIEDDFPFPKIGYVSFLEGTYYYTIYYYIIYIYTYQLIQSDHFIP